MMIEKLTAFKIMRISKPGKYGDGNGLYLYVSKNLVKSWVFRYQIYGIEHYMGLGSLHAINLKEAREEARKARACLARGNDPLQDRKAMVSQRKLFDASNKTFDECAAEYIAKHKDEWKNEKHRMQWESTLKRYVSPHFGKIYVRLIGTSHVLMALDPIWTGKTETATRLRERIERILSWANTHHYREGENPARWHGHLQELLPNPSRIKHVRHHPSMLYQKIGGFFGLLNIQEGIEARALEFTILTACRTSEALKARWQEIDLAQRVWLIPGERMKGGQAHRVPLTGVVLEILSRLMGLHPKWVFPNTKMEKPLYSTAMLDVLEKMNCAGVTVHGFRSSFRIWAAEMTAYPKEVVELALAHKQATAVEEAYQRSDLFERRRALMQDWAGWCTTVRPGTHVPVHSPTEMRKKQVQQTM